MERNRFTNNASSQFENSNRTVINGYQDLAVPTLGEAVEELIPIVPGIDKQAENAKVKCNRNSNLLTLDESAAVYLYTMPDNLFSCLNRVLRDQDRQDRDALEPWFPFLKLLMTALEKLPLTTGTVWRGVNYDDAITYVDKDVHIWRGVNSCSINLKNVEPYLGENGTLFAIDTTHGRKISAFSAIPDEEEVILTPGTRVRAVSESLRYNDSLSILHLKEENSLSESRPEPNHLFKMIRQKYQENGFIERIMNPAKTIPIEQSYINLSMVESKEQRNKEKKLDTEFNDTILCTFEEIYGVKESIDVKNIFEKCKDARKQVLIFGRAGIGKTTFCQYVTFQWASGAIWQQYELVIFIRLRSLTDTRYPSLGPGKNYCLLDLVRKEYFHHGLSEQDELLLKEQLNKSEVLWLLDGYDEIIQSIPAHLQYSLEQLLKTPHHILTSRPYMNTLSHNVQMEITGFTDDNIKKYIEQFFDQIKDEINNARIQGEKLLTFLKHNPRIWGIVHIPVNLELICSHWCDTDWSETTAMTMTTVYDKMTEWLCRRHLQKQNISLAQMTKEDVYADCNKELEFLESLAFNGMESNSIILRPKLLRIASRESACSLKQQPHLLNIGILKSLDYKPIGTYIEADKNHYFVHLSFQEYFTAQYLIKALNLDVARKKKAIDFMKNHKYNQRFELVFTFASGLLINSDDKQSMDLFWSIILGEPLDLIGLSHVQLVIACIEETICNPNLPRFHESMNFIESMNCIIKWIKYFVSRKHAHRYIHIDDSLRRSPSLVNQSEIIDTLIMLYQNDNRRISYNTYSLISYLPISNSLLDLSSLRLKAFSMQDYTVYRIACEIIGEMDEKAATDEVICELVKALQSDDDLLQNRAFEALMKLSEKPAIDVVINGLLAVLQADDNFPRSRVFRALRKIGERIGTAAFIDRFVNALLNPNGFVRHGACCALGQLGERASTNEVVSSLKAALTDEDYTVRKSACYALGRIGEKTAINEVIAGLVTALRDTMKDVRRSACKALGQMGEKTASNEVIAGLVTALQDTNENVRSSACEALGQIGEKAATDEVISSLMSAIVSENTEFADLSCNALMKMGAKASTYEVIITLVRELFKPSFDHTRRAHDTLMEIYTETTIEEVIDRQASALGDENSVVRSDACDILKKIGETIATTKVCNNLVIAFQDANHYGKHSVCKTLGEIGYKAATTEVINILMTAVTDKYDEVRQSACYALGRMGEKAASIEVINSLVAALRDANHYVRCGACEALGQIGEQAASIEVINSLVFALQDLNLNVRCSAYKALGQMGEKAAIKEVFQSLVVAVFDKNFEVRLAACNTLGKFGEMAANNEVINSLMAGLEDVNPEVRYSAWEAIEKLGEKAASVKIINQLMRRGGKKNSEVRLAACSAIRKVCHRGVTNEMVIYLLNALEDDSIKVALRACEALRIISTKGISMEFMSEFTTVLKSGNYTAKSSVCQFLEIIGEKAATNEVINELLNIYLSDGCTFRDDAFKAIKKILPLCSSMSILKRDTVSKMSLCMKRYSYDFFREIPLDRFVKSFLETGISFWIPCIKMVALEHGYGITVTENTVTLYSNKETVALPILNRKLYQELKDGLVN